MKSIALLILVTCTSALRRHRLETTAATLRGGEGRWRKVKGGASSLRSSARAWADYLTGVNGTNVTIWATKKKLKKPTVGPEDQYEVAEAFAAAARAVTRPSLRVIATTVVPACGAVLANGMFLASWPAVAQARTSKQLGALNPLPFAFTFANCLGWLHYGFVCRNHYVFWSNALGCVLGLLYTTTALKLGCPDVVERVAVGGLVIHIGAAYVTGLRLASPAKRKLCAGLVANFILLCYYAAPLSTVAAVVRSARIKCRGASIHWFDLRTGRAEPGRVVDLRAAGAGQRGQRPVVDRVRRRGRGRARLGAEPRRRGARRGAAGAQAGVPRREGLDYRRRRDRGKRSNLKSILFGERDRVLGHIGRWLVGRRHGLVV